MKKRGEAMPKSKRKRLQRDSLPENFRSLEEFWEFWDTHSTADYADQMPAVRAAVKIQSKKVYCPLAGELASGLPSDSNGRGGQERVGEPAASGGPE